MHGDFFNIQAIGQTRFCSFSIIYFTDSIFKKLLSDVGQYLSQEVFTLPLVSFLGPWVLGTQANPQFPVVWTCLNQCLPKCGEEFLAKVRILLEL